MSARDKLVAAFEKLKAAVDHKLQEIELSVAPDATVDEALEDQACEYIKPMIQRVLLMKLQGSGLKRRTGRLELALKGADVWVQHGKRGAKIVIGFRAGIPGDRGASDPDKRPVYLYGAALNFGAVHTPSNHALNNAFPGKRAGRRLQQARRSLKRRAYRNVGKGYNQVAGRIATLSKHGGHIYAGNATITHARNFFVFTPNEQAQIANHFQTFIRAKIAERRKGSGGT